MSQNLNGTCLPIVKFSHNTSQLGVRNFVWNHVNTRKDLLLNFSIQSTASVDELGNYVSRVVMKVTAGTETLEMQDLGDLVRICRDAGPVSGDTHPIQIVIKSPMLAMRYPHGDGNNVRRFQVKFVSDTVFARALNTLMELGLPISDANHGKASGSTNLISSIIPPTAPSFLGNSFGSSTTAIRSTSIPPPTYHKPLQQYARSDHLLSKSSPVPAVSINSDNPMSASASDNWRPFSAPSYMHIRSASNLSPPSAFSTSLNQARVRMPILYESQIERQAEHNGGRTLQEEPQYRVTSPSQGQIDTVEVDQSKINFQYYNSLAIPPQESLKRLATSSPYFSAKSTLGSSPPKYGISQENEDDMFNSTDQLQRSTPDVTGDLNSDVMPPKRILPFPNPRDNGKARSSSASDARILPKATLLSRAESTINVKSPPDVVEPAVAKKLVKKRVAQRKAPTSSSIPNKTPSSDTIVQPEQPAPETSSITALQEGNTPLEVADESAANQTAFMKGQQSKPVVPKKRATPRPSSAAKRLKMVDHGTQTDPPPFGDHSTMGLPDAPIALPQTAKEPKPVDPPASYLDAVDAFITQHKMKPPAQEIWETPAYIDASDDERKSLINNFICDNLEDENFVRLCEDIDTCWRRMALQKP